MPSKGACKEGSWEKQLRNGSVFRNSLPLRKREIGGARSWREAGSAAAVI